MKPHHLVPFLLAAIVACDGVSDTKTLTGRRTSTTEVPTLKQIQAELLVQVEKFHLSDTPGWARVCFFDICGDCYTHGPTGDSYCWLSIGETLCSGTCQGDDCSGVCVLPPHVNEFPLKIQDPESCSVRYPTDTSCVFECDELVGSCGGLDNGKTMTCGSSNGDWVMDTPDGFSCPI